VRVPFTVALLVAVAAVALPAVDVASVDRAESGTRGAVDRLVDAARTLAAGNDALAGRGAAARRTLVVDLPAGGFATAELAFLSVGPANGSDTGVGTANPETTRVAWRVEGGRRHVTQVDDLRLRSPDGDRFRLNRGGRHRLVLALVQRDARVVTVSRIGDGGPSRTFK